MSFFLRVLTKEAFLKSFFETNMNRSREEMMMRPNIIVPWPIRNV